MRINTDEARELFATSGIARLTTVGPGHTPHLVPVRFAAIDYPAGGSGGRRRQRS